MTRSDAAAVYSYGVAWPFDQREVTDLRGVDGAPVSVVEHDGVVAVVSALSPAEANPRVLRARLERLDEVEALARAHHAVVDAIATHTTIVPFRLATIHAGERPVAELLRRRHRHFATAHERVAGCSEIGVKVYALPDAPVDDPPPDTGSTSPGRDFLRQRQRAAHRRESAQRGAVAVAQRVEAELGELATECRLHRPQDPQLSGLPGENVLNAAYLVDSEDVDRFVARAGELGGDAPVRVVVSGPWAPYSFADVEETSS